jgi:hypothetical protein
MWNIALGYLKANLIWHWELVLEYDCTDDSLGCPEDCTAAADEDCGHEDPDPSYFQLINGEIVPLDHIHIVHVVYDEEKGKFVFEYKMMKKVSTYIATSKSLGTFQDRSLRKIVEGCRAIPPPLGGEEDCQSWIWKSLREVVKREGNGNLVVDYEKILEKVKDEEAEYIIG